MSYEGYEQHICEKGHHFDTPAAYAMEDEKVECSCGASSVWCNSVDDTNCDEQGVIPAAGWETLKLTDEVVKTCSLGFKHVVQEATYRVPTEAEHRKLQCYRHPSGPYVPLGS